MFALDETVGLCVVAGDADVVDAVSFGKGIERSNKWFAIVGHNCLGCAPSAKNILENKVSERFVVFGTEHSGFGI
jgi:hypothetical protein